MQFVVQGYNDLFQVAVISSKSLAHLFSNLKHRDNSQTSEIRKVNISSNYSNNISRILKFVFTFVKTNLKMVTILRAKIKHVLNRHASTQILDVGCGKGYVGQYLKDKETGWMGFMNLHGIDF